jgi:hypothetical protein
LSVTNSTATPQSSGIVLYLVDAAGTISQVGSSPWSVAAPPSSAAAAAAAKPAPRLYRLPTRATAFRALQEALLAGGASLLEDRQLQRLWEPVCWHQNVRQVCL